MINLVDVPLVTVTIPEPAVERLSSRERSRGTKPRRGWWRHVVRVGPEQRGGYALIGDPPFLPPGERLLPVGSVLVESHYDGDARIVVVAYDGALISRRDPSNGRRAWLDLKQHTVTFCGQVLDAMTLGRDQRALLEQAVERLRTYAQDPENADDGPGYLAKAVERLAGLPAPDPHREDAITLLAHERDQAIEQIRGLMAKYGINRLDL